jgi:tetratricopeptide (TPR) repeat protein
VYLLLNEWPILQNTASVMAGAAVLLFGWLGLREDRDFFQRLSHFLGRARPAQATMAIVLVAGLALWGGVGWPRLQAIVAGPLGPRQPGVQRFAIGEWKNLTPGRSSFEGIWTDGTRRTLYEKLSRVQALQGIALDSPQVTDEVRRDLDLWIDGDFSKIVNVKLSAAIAGRAGRYLRSVAVQREVDEGSTEVESHILALQDELAQTILSALGIQLQPAVVEAIRQTPTGSAQALQLNNQAALLVAQDDLSAAEPLLRAALTLDPAYADAHNNLGRLLQLRGDLPGAVAEYRRAIELLPRIPLYYFNLGLAHDRGQDFPAAIRAYEQAVALDPTYVKALNNLGFVYLEMGKLDKASELFQRGLYLNPDASYLHKNLGRVYLEQRRPAAAIAELKGAVELSDVPYAEALFYLAQAYRDAGQVTDACAVLANYAKVAAVDAYDEPGRPAAARTLTDELRCP